MKTFYINIFCNQVMTVVAVEATCLVEAQRLAVPAFRSLLKLRRAIDKANSAHPHLSFNN